MISCKVIQAFNTPKGNFAVQQGGGEKKEA